LATILFCTFLFGEALMVNTRAAIAMPCVKLGANRVFRRLERLLGDAGAVLFVLSAVIAPGFPEQRAWARR